MKKVRKIYIAWFTVLFLATFMFGGVLFTKVKAAAIPAGGAAFESATAISAGTYTVGALAERENHYYSISLKAGQELSVTGTFKVVTENQQYGTMNTIEIFDDAKESLVSQFKDAGTPVVVAALADSSKSTHTFYIRISDDTWGTESGTLEVILNDRFDANSGTDAGGDFDSALATTAGSYTGYLSRLDVDDYYTIAGVKGNVSAKITPAKDVVPEVKILDANRKELASESSANEGEIITASAEISADQKVYIDVKCDYAMGCEGAASQYSLVISNGAGGVVTPDVVPDAFLDFGTVVPVVPTGEAAKIDNIVKPPLNKVFSDNVKAKEATKDKIVYVVERAVTVADLEAIKAAMVALGYKTKSSTADTLIMKKGFKEIKFEIRAGSNQITVTQKSLLSPLWIGIIAGGVILLVLIIVVIVIVSKKKKPTASQGSTPPSTPTAPTTPPAPVKPAAAPPTQAPPK